MDDEDIKQLKSEKWNNVIPIQTNFMDKSNRKFEHARVWTGKLLLAAIILLVISIIFIVSAFVVYIKKPHPSIYANSKNGDIYLLDKYKPKK